MGLWSYMKQWFIMHCIIGYIFFASGLIVCFLMFLTYIFVYPWSRSLFRKIVYVLAYTHWSQFTFLAQWWSGSECDVFVENMEDLKYFGKEHVLAIMNHKYDIDWLMSWMVCERLGMLAGTKVYAKNSLRYVPLLGWAWIFVETIFLQRNWEKDRKKIMSDLHNFADYPDNYWITLLLFPEGTRFTEEKHAKSLEVCKAKGLPELKHHLLPRTKGFVVSVQAIKDKFPAILNLTLGICPGPYKPSLMNVIQGRPMKAELYVKRVPISTIPMDDEGCSQYLINVFQEKDKLFDYFTQNGSFEGRGIRVKLRKRYFDLIVWAFWAIVLYLPVFYYSSKIFLSGSIYVQLAAIAVVVIVSIVIRMMIAMTEIEKGSDYGRHLKHSHSVNNHNDKSD